MTPLSGKAVCPSPRRVYSPKEAASALAEWGVAVSEKGIRRACKKRKLRRVTSFGGRYYIPETELFRWAGIVDQAEPEGAA